MREYLLSWDVAQKQDKTALQLWRRTPSIVPGNRIAEDRVFNYLDLVYQREMEGVPYTEQCKAVQELLNGERMKNNCDLVIDGTGIGQAVVDIMREHGLEPIPIVFTSGLTMNVKYAEATRRFGGFGKTLDLRTIAELCVPKVDMIHAAKVLLEQNRIRIATGVANAEEFKKQLLHFKGKVNERGNVSYGNDAEAKHDDWVACFIMACWFANYSGQTDNERKVPKSGGDTYKSWNPLGNTEW